MMLHFVIERIYIKRIAVWQYSLKTDPPKITINIYERDISNGF